MILQSLVSFGSPWQRPSDSLEHFRHRFLDPSPQDAEHSLQSFQLSQVAEARVSEIAYFEKYDRLMAGNLLV